jgi:MFS superfamily sulfate permease-like transporter
MKNFIQTNYIQPLKTYWKSDLMAGFLVSLIALPLCLGIAGASGFPPIMGILTAIVGGLIVSFFSGSHLTIKGPAAGLIVIVAGCVEGFGGGDIGWKLTLGVVVIAAIAQYLLGVFKAAKLADIFPVSAVHGLLAAIGVIIISRQFHLLLGEDPTTLKGKEPFELLLMFPHAFEVFNTSILIIGLVSLGLLYIWPFIPIKPLKKIPAALVVLVVSICMSQNFHLSDPEFASLKPLVQPGELSFDWNVDFGGMLSHPGHFIEYVILFLIIGSLEALLSNKAIDMMVPSQQKSDNNKDLKALGIGNAISGILGGLPMISEIARSTSNVMNGGHTRWSNFFHGLFLLIYVVALAAVITLIPVAALSAMLVFVGLRLASAKEFRKVWAIGKDQFIIFMVTMFVSFMTDLLLGVVSGIAVELFFHLGRGMNMKQAFKATLHVTETEDSITIAADGAVVFTNLSGFKKILVEYGSAKNIVIDLSRAAIVDHTAMEMLHHFQEESHQSGRHVTFVGLEVHRAVSNHLLATHYIKK